jgi:hypothetical protein
VRIGWRAVRSGIVDVDYDDRNLHDDMRSPQHTQRRGGAPTGLWSKRPPPLVTELENREAW